MTSVCLGIFLEAGFAATLRRELGSHHLRTYAVGHAPAALALLDQWRFEAVILDADAIEAAQLPPFLASVAEKCSAPVLLVSSHSHEDRQLKALACGATEFVAKPVSGRLAAAKVRRLIDSAYVLEKPERSAIFFGNLHINPRRQQASVDGKELALTVSEFNLLFLLASRLGDYVSREAIADLLPRRGRNSEGTSDGRSADMHVCRVRKKLLQAGLTTLQLQAAYGRGYRMQLSASTAEPAQAAAAADETPFSTLRRRRG